MAVLYLDEYKNSGNISYGELLHYYDKLDGYLHEMSPEEIITHINRNGKNSSILQKLVVRNYFRWLSDNYSAEVSEEFINNNYEFEKMLREDDSQYIGFYTLTELKQTIEHHMRVVESLNNDSKYATDYYGLKAIWFLEWYGVLAESAISIKLSDVADDGSEVYIPAENRTIKIDDVMVSGYLAEYKARTGIKKRENGEESPYMQDTFYRTTSNADIKVKTIYNIKDRFKDLCPDERFDKRRLYYAGRYNQMLLNEENIDCEYSINNSEHRQIIQQIFNRQFQQSTLERVMTEYKLYKKGYLENFR